MKEALEMLLSCQNVLSNETITALYCRLSVDDPNGGDEDSNSIQHQKEMLLAYCKANGYTNVRVYVDDGYSGTNFNRPDFKRMIADIEAGEVGRVIIKDMSRLGRDYLQVGMYTVVFFQEHDVHFIAISDGVDSQKGDNELTPFRNLFNEWYARDCSKKQRAVKRLKGMSGQRVATQIPYGYLKGEDGKLVLDPETAPTVKLIFELCLQGYGPTQIARLLTEKGNLPTPGTIEAQRTKRKQHYHPDALYTWSEKSVAKILERKEYLGHTVNFKSTTKSYKCKKRIEIPEDQQMVIENTHEAIIDQDTFYRVQVLRQQRRRPTKLGEMGMFSGLVFCADCGARMHQCRSSTWTKEQECFTCANVQRRIDPCSRHYIRVVVLEELVRENLRQVAAMVKDHEAEFVRQIASRTMEEQRRGLGEMKKALGLKEKRIVELDNIIKRLYEDNIIGKLTDERFKILSDGYEQEQGTLKEEVQQLQADIQEADGKTVNISSFLKAVKKYTDFEELTPGMLRDLIEKIVVHAPDKSSGHRQQKVDIYYTFVGELTTSHEVVERKRKAA